MKKNVVVYYHGYLVIILVPYVVKNFLNKKNKIYQYQMKTLIKLEDNDSNINNQEESPILNNELINN